MARQVSRPLLIKSSLRKSGESKRFYRHGVGRRQTVYRVLRREEIPYPLAVGYGTSHKVLDWRLHRLS